MKQRWEYLITYFIALTVTVDTKLWTRNVGSWV